LNGSDQITIEMNGRDWCERISLPNSFGAAQKRKRRAQRKLSNFVQDQK
jgi:hypothetical protein